MDSFLVFNSYPFDFRPPKLKNLGPEDSLPLDEKPAMKPRPNKKHWKNTPPHNPHQFSEHNIEVSIRDRREGVCIRYYLRVIPASYQLMNPPPIF